MSKINNEMKAKDVKISDLEMRITILEKFASKNNKAGMSSIKREMKAIKTLLPPVGAIYVWKRILPKSFYARLTSETLQTLKSLGPHKFNATNIAPFLLN